MARKVIDYRIEKEGRDQGKVFRLTEMPASQSEKWAIRAFMAMGAAGVEIPEGVQENGVSGLASMSHQLIESIARMPFSVAEPLLDEMMTCVKMVPNPDDTSITRQLVESDIEEIGTRFKLRMEIFKLHADFTDAAAE